MTYSPKPGTAAFRILGWLEAQGATREFTASQIAEALGLTSGTVPSYLESALAAHLLFSRRRDYTHPKAPIYYSLTDHGIRQRMEMRPGGVGWMSPPPKSDDDVPTFRGRATTSNSQRHESGAQTDPNATGNGNMARNTEHAAPLGGLAEGEGATAPSPGLREAKADEGRPGTTPSRGRIELAVPQFRSITTINRKDAEESGSSPGTPGTAGTPAASCTSSAAQAATDAPSGEGPAAADAPRARAVDPGWPVADRLLPGDYLVHKRSGIELVYGEGELQPSRVSVPNDGAKFALWCDGELTLFVGDTELTLKPAQVARLRRLLGGGC